MAKGRKGGRSATGRREIGKKKPARGFSGKPKFPKGPNKPGDKRKEE